MSFLLPGAIPGDIPGATSGSGSAGLLESLTPLAANASGYNGNAAMRTGIKQLINFGKSTGLLTPMILNTIVPELQGIFGGYPAANSQERGPDGLFIALFAILFLFFLVIWFINTSRRHYFHIYLGGAFYCLMKVIGYACRIAWSYDVSHLPVGITSVVFIQVAPLVLLSLNMVLAHRVLTWRHPEIGIHWIVVQFLNSIYLMVISIVVMAIVGEAIPFLYFLDQHHYNMCKNVMKAAAVLNVVYACLPLFMLAIAFALPPGTFFKPLSGHREIPEVYQANWIKRASLFYHPKLSEKDIIYKGEPGCNAIRIIPSREPPGYSIYPHGEPMHPLSPRLHWAIMTVTMTTLALLLISCIRLASAFYTGNWADMTATGWKAVKWVQKAYVMHIFYGAVEFLIVSTYLLMRIDLRFYIPDLPKGRNEPDLSLDSFHEKASVAHRSVTSVP